MSRASESGHWYMRDGTPMYEVPTADGRGMRSCTLRDARKLGLFPGVTSIIKCAAAPALERWKEDQAILAALTLPRTGNEPHEVLMAKIREDAGAQAKKAANEGTRFHAAIQGHHEGTPPDEEMWTSVKAMNEAIAQNFGPGIWRPELPCAHASGFGTKSDLSRQDALIDFKGTEGDKAKLAGMKTWESHWMQLAATRKALHAQGKCDADADCAIGYFSRTHKDEVRILRVDEPELEQGWLMFSALLNYWKAKNKYWPELFSHPDKIAA
jgi:hypothetical protein